MSSLGRSVSINFWHFVVYGQSCGKIALSVGHPGSFDPPTTSVAPSSQCLKQLGQYGSSPGHRGYCYAELAFSSLAMAVTIASTYCTYP